MSAAILPGPPQLDRVEDLERGFFSQLAPPPRLWPDEWAGEYGRLPADGGSAEPGRYDPARFPFMVEVCRRLSPWDPCTEVTLVKSSQVGASTVARFALGYWIHLDPSSVMWLLPNIEMAKEWSKGPLQGMFDGTPVLRELVAPRQQRGSDSTLLNRYFPGGQLYIRGANSAAGFRATVYQRAVWDEVDSADASVGGGRTASGQRAGEGDIARLLARGMTTFPASKKLFRFSTPTITGESKIWQAFLRGDQRRYFVPCPACGAHQVLLWGRVDYKTHEHPHYRCIHCEEHIPESYKGWMMDLKRAEWRPSTLKDGTFVDLSERATDHYSYQIGSIYSPLGFFSWREMAKEWRSIERPEERQVFVNLRLGETWDLEGGDTIEASTLLERREGDESTGHYFRKGWRVPNDVAAIVMGIDTQDDRLEVAFWGYGVGHQAWVLDYVVIWGDTQSDAPYDELDAQRERRFVREDGVPVPVYAAIIDAGGHATSRVVEYAHERYKRRVFAILGRAGAGKPVWARTPTRMKMKGRRAWIVGVDDAKAIIYARAKRDTPGPGYIHLPRMFPSGVPCDEEWIDQLLGERRRLAYPKGRPVYVWKPKKAGQRVEVLDTSVYALAGLFGCEQGGLSLQRTLDRLRGAAASRTSQAEPDRPGTERRKRPRKSRGWGGGGGWS